MTLHPFEDHRNACLGDLKAAIARTYDGVVACAARVEQGVVVDHEVKVTELPEHVKRTMTEAPRKERREKR